MNLIPEISSPISDKFYDLLPPGQKVYEDVKIYLNTCIHCSKKNAFSMLASDYYRWKVTRHYVQDVFPTLTSQDREILISGTHPDCWREIFPDPDED